MLSLYCDLNRSNAFAVTLLAVIRFQQGRTRTIKRSWLELSNKGDFNDSFGRHRRVFGRCRIGEGRDQKVVEQALRVSN
jgi:hypothetical protein